MDACAKNGPRSAREVIFLRWERRGRRNGGEEVERCWVVRVVEVKGKRGEVGAGVMWACFDW